ncbi:response regulator [Colwelliaceae bacterium 6471]
MKKKDLIDSRRISVYKLKSELINTVLIIFSVVALPALIGSLSRIVDIGFMPIMILHIAITLSLAFITIFRRKISFELRSSFVIVILILIGYAGLHNFGLSGNGIPFLLASIIFSSILFNMRTGIILFIINSLYIFIHVGMVLNNKIVYSVDFNLYNYYPTSWLTYLMSFFFICITLLIVLGRFNSFFFDMVENLEKHVHESTKELQQANRAKSEFLANMSHEIRTPMNGVLGLLSLLENTDLDENQRHKTNLAKSSAKSLLTLINDILDFSKVDAGKLELEVDEFNIRDMIGDFSEVMALKAQEKDIEIILNVTQIEQSIVCGDQLRLRQILTNLVGNAIKFTSHGEIIITASTHSIDANKLNFRCTVQDTGIGIPSDKLPKLFDAFSQVDASTTREFGGTGLGLSICKKLAQLMDGDISVISTSNQGSTFTVSIKINKSSQSQYVMPNIDLSALHILVVDDNVTNREVLTEQLRHWGANVTTASGGEQALEICNNIVTTNSPIFDLALLDMQMPHMDGASLGKLLRANPLFNDMKLVMMTAMAVDNDAQYFADLGFNGYFAKPATTSDLFNALAVVADNGAALKNAKPLVTHEYIKTLKPSDTNGPSSKNSNEELNGKHILLVEDNRINQMVAIGILKSFGITVDVAINGIEALKCLKQAKKRNPYQLILMDCQMPEMDGYQTSKEIRSGNAGDIYQDIVIIAMTANAMAGDREKCLAIGMNDYLSKPIEPDLLAAKLQLWLLGSQTRSNMSNNNVTENDNDMHSTNDAQTPIWDKKAVLKRVRDNHALLHMLVDSFLEEIPERMAQLQDAVNKNDTSAILHISHTIKGISANLSGMVMQQAAAILESKLKGKQVDDSIDELHENLINACNEFIDTLTEFNKTTPAN